MHYGGQLHPGMVIYYRLPLSQRPTHPEKEWQGRLLSVHIGEPNFMDMALVECLDDGYDHVTEYVQISQITRLEN